MSRENLTEFQAKQRLRTAGLPVADARECATANEAADAACAIGFPVVLKVSHADIAHKSDVGGVVVDIHTEATAHQTAARLLALRIGARVLVEAQAAPGVDLLLGARRDPVFGPTVLVGLGGVYAEIMDDVAVFVGTPTDVEARAMFARLRGAALLTGARGRAAVDLDAAAEAVVHVAELLAADPSIVELDVNPLRVWTKGALALDALIVRETDARETRPAPPRDSVAMVAPLFRPRGVAVVGASATAEKAGNIVLGNLRAFDYPGAVYPVNPNAKEIAGLACYARVTDCPQPLDLVVVAVPHDRVEAVMADAAAAGVRHAIVMTGGFADAGEEGLWRETELMALCRRHGIHLMGPNSIGTVDAVSRFCVSIGKLPAMAPTGIALAGQTGTFATGYTLEESTWRGRGFGKVACLGNKADIDESDFLEFFAADPDTRVVGLYLEAAGDGPRFMAAAKHVAAAKPLVVLKSGRTPTGAAAAASHTGSLAGADRVYDAVFRQCGAQRVDDLPAMLDALRAFDMCPLPAGNRVGVVSITGIGCVLAADACDDVGLAIAPLAPETRRRLRELAPPWATMTNPADIWSTIEQLGPHAAYQQIASAIAADLNVDIVLVIHVLLAEGAFDAAEAFAEVKKVAPDKPILACHLGGRADLVDAYRRGLERIGIPVTDSPAASLRAAALLVERTAFLDRIRTRR